MAPIYSLACSSKAVLLAAATMILTAITFALLRRLGDLEQQQQTVTPTMRRMHRIAITLPPVGLGLVLLLARFLG